MILNGRLLNFDSNCKVVATAVLIVTALDEILLILNQINPVGHGIALLRVEASHTFVGGARDKLRGVQGVRLIQSHVEDAVVIAG